MRFLAILIATLALSACVTNPQQQMYAAAPVVPQSSGRAVYATVQHSQACKIAAPASTMGNIAGTGIGAALGGLAGSNIGKGNGKKAATVVGAGVGGYIGHSLVNAPDNGVCMTLQTDTGRTATINQKGSPAEFYPGRRVIATELANGSIQVTPVN